MAKTDLHKPVLIYFLGLPGSGKSFVSRNLAEVLKAAYISSDRVRHELFESPRYDKEEDIVVSNIVDYMTKEFLNAGLSVVLDQDASRSSIRRQIANTAKNSQAEPILVWIQIDPETAYQRTQARDRRTADDKYAKKHNQPTFKAAIDGLQTPKDEKYVVVSGKHSFTAQKNAILNYLYRIGLLSVDGITNSITKPGLVNLVPNSTNDDKVDFSKRNILIR